MKKRYRITIKGKVQGVFYRQGVKKKAKELCLAGFVQNMEDGSVYIEAEGNEQALQELVLWCNQGPIRARVASVEYEIGEHENLTEFVILG